MKRVLFISPSSYPVHSAESVVNMKLLHALSTSGDFDIDLISRREKYKNYPTFPISKLGCSFNNHIIIEVDNKIWNPIVMWQNLMALFKFGFWFKGCHWAYPALIQAETLISKNTYDYVVTKNAPSLLVGYYLKKKYGIKWVASWNDPFPDILYPAPYGQGLEYRTKTVNKLIHIMEGADVHIFPNIRLKAYMNKYLNIENKKQIVVPHLVNNSTVEDYYPSDTLQLIHSGNLGYPRNPRNLIEGMRKALKLKPDMKFCLTILGRMSESDREYVDNSGISHLIRYLPPVDYFESLAEAKKYDVAIIIEADCAEGIFLPTKVGDYMQLHIPIFSISPSIGVLHDLYDEGYVSYFAPVSSIDAICKELLRIYDDFTNNHLGRTNRIKKEFLQDYIVSEYSSI